MTAYYISTSGDDSDGLSWATAFNTIAQGIAAASGSDSITIDDGTFSGASNRGLTIGAGITIQSRNGLGNTTIDLGGADRFASLSNVDLSNLVISGLRFYNGTGANGGGIDSAGHTGDPLITMCEFDTCDASSSHGGGIRVETSDITVTRCRFISCTSAAGTGGINHHGNGNRMHVSYCYFDSCGGAYGGGAGWYGTDTPNHEIYNCSFYNCTSSLAANNGAIWGSGSTATIRNCAADSCGSDPWAQSLDGDAEYCIAAYALAGTGNVNADPLFTDPSNGDFTLQSTSQAIDSGSNAVWSGTADVLDFAGVAITNGSGTVVAPGGTVDMGAYEYGSAGGALLLSTPISTLLYNR